MFSNSEKAIVEYLKTETARLHKYALWYTEKNDRSLFTRNALSVFLSESMRLQEQLDFFNANANKKWKGYRESISAMKSFSNLSYILCHIYHQIGRYCLGDISDEFSEKTSSILDTLHFQHIELCRLLLKLGSSNGLKFQKEDFPDLNLNRPFPNQRFKTNIEKKEVDVYDYILKTANDFLDLCGEWHVLKPVETDGSYKNIIEICHERFSEETFRTLQYRLHNLQSFYDTNIGLRKIEKKEKDLAGLRGHISVLYHLFDAATIVSHFFFRHCSDRKECIVSKDVFGKKQYIQILNNYILYFVHHFLLNGAALSRSFLRKYSEIVECEIMIPKYRGFHVRPSTLIAKIVQHYGMDVEMRFEDSVYDPGTPLDLFRVNEVINRRKRNEIKKMINELDDIEKDHSDMDYLSRLRSVLTMLLKDGKIILYDKLKNCLKPDDMNFDLRYDEFVNTEISRMMAVGKLDIDIDLYVTFKGDKRILEDIEILAEHGYGENRQGENVALPRELSYLFRDR